MTTETETTEQASEQERNRRIHEEQRVKDARIAVGLFDWRWFARDTDQYGQPKVGLFPPENDPMGYARVNFYAPAWTDVTGHEERYPRFSDWARLGYRSHPIYQQMGEYLPHFCTDPAAMMQIIEKMAEPGMYDEKRGYWFDVHTPFEPGKPFFGGFTPHGFTGWNGRPDHRQQEGSPTFGFCVVNAALDYLNSREGQGKG